MDRKATIGNMEEVNSLLLKAEDLMADIRQNSEIGELDAEFNSLEADIQDAVKESQEILDDLNNNQSDYSEEAIGDDYQVIDIRTNES